MKKLTLLTIALLAIAFGNAQNVGIGTTTPTAKLEVVGNIKIVDGTQALNKVLTTDATGLATWSAKGIVQPNTYVISDVKNDANLLANNYSYKSSFNVNTKIASTVNLAAENWSASSYFSETTTSPAVINGAGNNFVVFGGYNGTKNISSGAIYDAINDAWIGIPDMGDDLERSVPVVVWANGKLFVWGGFQQKAYTQIYHNTGKIYDPVTKVWTAIPALNAPSGRYITAYAYNQATNEVAIWGGSGSGAYLGDGAKYNFNTNTWATLPTLAAPTARGFMGFASGLGKFFIFGGILQAGGNSTTSHFYDFASNTWTAPTASGLSARYNAHTVFTGSSFLVWGGNGTSVGNEGSIYSLGSNTWNAMSTVSSPPGPNICNTTFSNGYFIHQGVTDNNKYSILTNTWSPLNDFETRGSNGIAGNTNGLFIWGGNANLNFGAEKKQVGARYFWNAQNITINTTQPEEYYLYKKN